MIERARELMSLGLSVIPVPYKQKGPKVENWKNVRVTEANFDEYFKPRKQYNIGVLLGEPSDNVVDIDLDCPEAVELAPKFLPEGARCFGRKSKRRSHWIYRLSEPMRSRQFADDDDMMLEFRSTDLQTVFPGSVHASGETIEWESHDPIVTVDAHVLRKACDAMANEILVRRGKQPRNWDDIPESEPEPSLEPENIPKLDKRKKRARRYVARMPAAKTGHAGHAKTFHAAQALRRGFGLPEESALELLREFNSRCEPPWSEKDLRHKIDSAARCGRMGWYSLCLNEAPTLTETEQAPDAVWNPRDLIIGSEGSPIANTSNAVVYLTKHPDWRDTLAYDAFKDSVLWVANLPSVPGMPAPEPGVLQDEHIAYVMHWFGHHGLKLEKTHVVDAIPTAAKINRFNSLHDYLNSLNWDKIPRLSRWLHTYLGVEDNKYTRSVGKWFMMSTVVRGYKPGEKMDYMLVLEGLQGKKKSTVVSIIAKSWFLEGLPDIRDKDAADALNGHWIVEVDELDAMRKAGTNRVKSWVSKKKDTYRPAYGRFKVTRARSCSFIGTTNDFEYLDDPTGARRFWPVRVGRIDIRALERDIDQLWAEAKHLVDAKEVHYPEDDRDPMLTSEQEKRYQIDPWEDKISTWIGRRDAVTVEQVLTEGLLLTYSHIAKKEEMRAANCLRRLGFERGRVNVGNGQVRGWLRTKTT